VELTTPKTSPRERLFGPDVREESPRCGGASRAPHRDSCNFASCLQAAEGSSVPVRLHREELPQQKSPGLTSFFNCDPPPLPDTGVKRCEEARQTTSFAPLADGLHPGSPAECAFEEIAVPRKGRSSTHAQVALAKAPRPFATEEGEDEGAASTVAAKSRVPSGSRSPQTGRKNCSGGEFAKGLSQDGADDGFHKALGTPQARSRQNPRAQAERLSRGPVPFGTSADVLPEDAPAISGVRSPKASSRSPVTTVRLESGLQPAEVPQEVCHQQALGFARKGRSSPRSSLERSLTLPCWAHEPQASPSKDAALESVTEGLKVKVQTILSSRGLEKAEEVAIGSPRLVSRAASPRQELSHRDIAAGRPTPALAAASANSTPVRDAALGRQTSAFAAASAGSTPVRAVAVGRCSSTPDSTPIQRLRVLRHRTLPTPQRQTELQGGSMQVPAAEPRSKPSALRPARSASARTTREGEEGPQASRQRRLSYSARPPALHQEPARRLSGPSKVEAQRRPESTEALRTRSASAMPDRNPNGSANRVSSKDGTADALGAVCSGGNFKVQGRRLSRCSSPEQERSPFCLRLAADTNPTRSARTLVISRQDSCADRISALKSELDLLKTKNGLFRQQLLTFQAGQNAILKQAESSVSTDVASTASTGGD